MKENHAFDLIILGGGLVGLTTANLCAKAGLSVVLVETKKPLLEWPKNTIDTRCSAISRNSQKIFEKLEIWDTIIFDGASPYEKMLVWDQLGFGEINFDAAEVAEPNLGYMIENRIMLRALWNKVKQTDAVLKISSKPLNLQINSKHVLLELEDQTALKAKLIIGADGGRSWLRETTGLRTVQKDYHQHALVATVKTEMEHQKTAWQRFLPGGPLAFLPLLDPQTVSIVWSSTKERNQELMNFQQNEFCQALAHAFDYRLGKVVDTGERQSFSLNMIHAKQVVAERIALIGDAAHVIHPLAGQGVNLGLSDALCISDILSYARSNDYDIGHYLVLKKYERARKSQVMLMIRAMEFFNQLFGSKLSLVAGLRSIGLNAVNKNQFLKKQIILHAMGI